MWWVTEWHYGKIQLLLIQLRPLEITTQKIYLLCSFSFTEQENWGIWLLLVMRIATVCGPIITLSVEVTESSIFLPALQVV